MDRGNVNPAQHLSWWLRETLKRTPTSLLSTGIWTRDSSNSSPVWWISIGAVLCAFKNFIIDQTSQSAGTGTRTSIFNRCNDATARTRESTTSACVMRHHYSIMYIHLLHAINGLLAVGRLGNLLCGRLSCFRSLVWWKWRKKVKLCWH